VNSPLAQVLAQKGTQPRTRASGVLVHTTGGGITAKAAAAGHTSDADVDAYVARHYAGAAEYPHYVIGRTGIIFALADELTWAAHASWHDWERQTYQSRAWQTTWAKDFLDARELVPMRFYADWIMRWGDRYTSPAGILAQVGGGSSPNGCYIGVELVDAKPFTEAQLGALAALFVDICRRHQLLDPAAIAPGSLPQPWLCGHSDVSPCRRWQRTGDGGFGWDPAPSNLDWRDLEAAIAAAATAPSAA